MLPRKLPPAIWRAPLPPLASQESKPRFILTYTVAYVFPSLLSFLVDPVVLARTRSGNVPYGRSPTDPFVPPERVLVYFAVGPASAS